MICSFVFNSGVMRILLCQSSVVPLQLQVFCCPITTATKVACAFFVTCYRGDLSPFSLAVSFFLARQHKVSLTLRMVTALVPLSEYLNTRFRIAGRTTSRVLFRSQTWMKKVRPSWSPSFKLTMTSMACNTVLVNIRSSVQSAPPCKCNSLWLLTCGI